MQRFIIAITLCGLAAAWTHYKQDEWPEVENSVCGEDAQSPINIVTKDTVRSNALREPFEFMGDSWTEPLLATRVGNTGHDYITYVDELSEDGLFAIPLANPYYATLRMQGGGLPGAPYVLWQFHFHQGSRSNLQGSEHFLDGKQYPAEVHFVFKSASEDQATDEVGWLAVLGFFVDVLDDEYGHNTGSIADFFNSIEMTRGSGDYRFLNNTMKLDTIIPMHDPDAMSRFYRYDGSLTTPGCNEIVAWTVFEDPIYISRSQYEQFMGGVDVDGLELKNNFRYLQDVNGRTVYRSPRAGVMDDDVDGGLSVTSSLSLLLTAAFAAILIKS